MAGRFDHLGRSLSELYSSPCLFPHSGTGNPVPSIPPTPVHHTPVRRQAQPGDACSPYRRSSRGDGRRRRRPPQSLQMILRRLCWQMLAPPQSLQPAPDAVMRADARAPAVLASAPLAVMLADARAPAVLAPAPLAVMLQMLAPPQSLQALLWRLCSQMLVPPQSLHLLLTRLCWQMLAPPQSLQLLLWRLRIYTRPPIGCLRISRPPSWSVWLCGQGVQLPAARRHDMLHLCGPYYELCAHANKECATKEYKDGCSTCHMRVH